MSREIDAARPARARVGLWAVLGAGVGLVLLGTPFVITWDEPPPAMPAAPAVDATEWLAPLPPIVTPPPLDAPTRRPQAAHPSQPETRRPPAPAIARPPAVATAPRADDGGVERRVLPEIPRSARNTISGRVRIDIRLSVDASGAVTAADSLSPDASRYFTGLAMRAAREWRFAPAPAERADVSREWILRFQLGRQDTTVTALPR